MSPAAQLTIVDQHQRTAALDTSRSFAVQAPAGSGKTELLSLRYLKLLALCEQPEEVLAITFTRKAAAEMAQRIVSTLEWAHGIAARNEAGIELDSEMDRNRYTAATNVLSRDTELGWELLLNPSRLRVQTIDSFCHHLASRLPLLSKLGSTPSISDQIDDCMEEAVRETLLLLESDSEIASSIHHLLMHFQNDTRRVEALLISLLKKRDQWLSALLEFAYQPKQAQAYLSGNLIDLISEQLLRLNQTLGTSGARLLYLANFAAANLNEAGTDSALLDFLDAHTLPSCDANGLRGWQALSSLLLTKDSKWRRTVTKREGFPAATGSAERKEEFKQRKSELLELIEELKEIPSLLEELACVVILPDPADNDTWPLLESITSIVPTLVAQLHLSFSGHGKIDYTQISEAALLALGSGESPTDLALMLDYKIKHILVDEFQDTSSTQNILLERLTAGWTEGDGRTLFLVGDGMQSCYSFRNANVGLFLAARERGLGALALEPLDLSTNFRSERGIVDWVNTIFEPAFPATTDLSRGAVPYTPAKAFHNAASENAVTTTLLIHDNTAAAAARAREADLVVEKIKSVQRSSPEDSIAVLVRSRSHLQDLLPTLRRADIAWRATEIDPLATLPVIDDLLSLLKALLNPADHLAWLSILRAPWCGLSTKQLLSLNQARSEWLFEESELLSDDEPPPASDQRPKTSMPNLISRLLNNTSNAVSAANELDEFLLDGAARNRLNHVWRVMDYAANHRYDGDLTGLTRFAWQQLSADSFYDTANNQHAIRQFFELMEASESAGQILDIYQFEDKVRRTYVSAVRVSGEGPGGNDVQIMTIHKAKGLEFDHVIIPGLSRRNPPDEKPLLLWHEHVGSDGSSSLLMATLAASGAEDSKLYKYLRNEQALKQQYESTRLLYIAVTRARKTALLAATLALTASTDAEQGEIPAPPSGSLLDTIWQPLIADPSLFVVESMPGEAEEDTVMDTPGQRTQGIRRFRGEHLRTLLTQQDLPPPAAIKARQPASTAAVVNSLATDCGVLIHQALQYLSDSDSALLQSDTGAMLDGLLPWWQQQLRWRGYTAAEVAAGSQRILVSVHNVLSNAQCNWIFGPELTAARNEMAMNTLSDGRLITRVIDRSFIDTNGRRWIVDYKSVQFSDLDSENQFQRRIEEQKQLYCGQLERYSDLFDAEVVLALLFTDLPRLVLL